MLSPPYMSQKVIMCSSFLSGTKTAKLMCDPADSFDFCTYYTYCTQCLAWTSYSSAFLVFFCLSSMDVAGWIRRWHFTPESCLKSPRFPLLQGGFTETFDHFPVGLLEISEGPSSSLKEELVGIQSSRYISRHLAWRMESHLLNNEPSRIVSPLI